METIDSSVQSNDENATTIMIWNRTNEFKDQIIERYFPDRKPTWNINFDKKNQYLIVVPKHPKYKDDDKLFAILVELGGFGHKNIGRDANGKKIYEDVFKIICSDLKILKPPRSMTI